MLHLNKLSSVFRSSMLEMAVFQYFRQNAWNSKSDWNCWREPWRAFVVLRVLDGGVSTQFAVCIWITGGTAFPENKLYPFYKLFCKTSQNFAVIFRCSCQSCWENSWYALLYITHVIHCLGVCNSWVTGSVSEKWSEAENLDAHGVLEKVEPDWTWVQFKDIETYRPKHGPTSSPRK